MDDMQRGAFGTGIFRFLSQWKGFATGVTLTLLVIAAAGITLAASTISDSFTDTSKIASNTNLTVDTTNGQVKLAVASSWTCGDQLIDTRDLKTYDTVQIDTQCWMAANLNVGTRVNGSGNQGTDCSSAAAIEKYCYADGEANCATYGALYQWDQAMCGGTTEGAQGICPAGWHIPTDAEQHTLDQYLATGTCAAGRDGAWDCSPAGTALKSGGSSGFEGLLAGGRDTDGSFGSLGTYGYFWSSSEAGASAWGRGLYSAYATVLRDDYSQAVGLSVRCLKD